MKEYEFKCEACGGNRLEEILSHVWQCSDIATIQLDDREVDAMIDYGEFSTDGGDIERYQCIKCGKTLQKDGSDINTAEELAEWMRQHGKPVEKEAVA